MGISSEVKSELIFHLYLSLDPDQFVETKFLKKSIWNVVVSQNPTDRTTSLHIDPHRSLFETFFLSRELEIESTPVSPFSISISHSFSGRTRRTDRHRPRFHIWLIPTSISVISLHSLPLLCSQTHFVYPTTHVLLTLRTGHKLYISHFSYRNRNNPHIPSFSTCSLPSSLRFSLSYLFPLDSQMPISTLDPGVDMRIGR